MSFAVTARCPGCHRSYIVSGSTAGEHPSEETYSFACHYCAEEIVAAIPGDADPERVAATLMKE